MKFDYHKFPLAQKSFYFGHSILKPVISIRLLLGDKELRYAALIDSGADFCIFDAQIGEYFGLDIRAGKKMEFGGVQDRGGAVAFLHEIILDVGGNTHTTTVGFSYDIAKHGFGILGQKGFFDIFTVKFDLIKEEVELKERK